MEALSVSLETAYRDAHAASLAGSDLDEAEQWDGLLQAMEHLQRWLASPGPWRRKGSPRQESNLRPAS